MNDDIGLSNVGYQDADQQTSLAFGGVAAQSFGPYGTMPTAATCASPYGALPDASVFSSPYGILPDASQFATTPALPTFANLPPDQAAGINTLNAQDLQTNPTGLVDDAALQAQLTLHEDSRNHVYTDTMGHPTVGIGFNLDRAGARDAMSAVGADYDAVRAGTQDLTDDQISQLAHTDTQHAIDVARDYYSGFDQLDPARQRTLVDMSFNLDSKINQFTGLHQALVDGDYDAAANHIASSLFARQTGHRGTDLTNQMRNGGQ